MFLRIPIKYRIYRTHFYTNMKQNICKLIFITHINTPSWRVLRIPTIRTCSHAFSCSAISKSPVRTILYTWLSRIIGIIVRTIWTRFYTSPCIYTRICHWFCRTYLDAGPSRIISKSFLGSWWTFVNTCSWIIIGPCVISALWTAYTLCQNSK